MIDFRVERGWAFDGYQAWIIEHRNNRSYIAKPVEFEFVELPEGALYPDPTLKLSGPLAREFMSAAKKALAGFTVWDKEDYEASARIEKAMQAHIDSLKMVVERIVK